MDTPTSISPVKRRVSSGIHVNSHGDLILKLLEHFILASPPPRVSDDFFDRDDPCLIANELLGHLLWTTTSQAATTVVSSETSVGSLALRLASTAAGTTRVTRKTAKINGVVREVKDIRATINANGLKVEDQDSNTLSEDKTLTTLQQPKENVVTVCRITEAEAYIGPEDRASHAYNNRRTPRNSVMYSKGGTAYCYLCYGVHVMFNVVTNRTDIPHVLLLRAGMPLVGLHHMYRRRNIDCKTNNVEDVSDRFLKSLLYPVARGPGNLTQCMGINVKDNGINMTNSERLWITKPIDITNFIDYVVCWITRHQTIILNNEKLSLDGELQKAFARYMLQSPSPLESYQWIAEFLNDKLSLFDTETTKLKIRRSPRIGIAYAGEDEKLPYRFYIDGDKSVSKFLPLKSNSTAGTSQKKIQNIRNVTDEKQNRRKRQHTETKQITTLSNSGKCLNSSLRVS